MQKQRHARNGGAKQLTIINLFRITNILLIIILTLGTFVATATDYDLKFFLVGTDQTALNIFIEDIWAKGITSGTGKPIGGSVNEDIITFNNKFRELNGEQVLKLWDKADTKKDTGTSNKVKLWDLIKHDEESRKKLVEAFDSLSPEDKNAKYKEIWNELDQYTALESEGINFGNRNKLLEVLDNEQSETLLSSVLGTDKINRKVILPDNIAGKDIVYKSNARDNPNKFSDNDKRFEIKDPDNKIHTIYTVNLPDNLETVELGQLKGSKSGYGVFYKEPNKRNIVLLNEEHYLQKSDNEREWIAKSIVPGEPDNIIGLDPTKGRVEIDSNGKIEMWGTPSLTGKDSIYVKINGQKFFPSPVGPQTPDKAYRYAFVKPLEDNVFNVKGNVIGKVPGEKGYVVGLFINDDNGVVSFKPKNQITSDITGKNLINIEEGGLDIQGVALNGKLSFSVSKETTLSMGDNKFTIKDKKDGTNYYTYTTKDGELYRGIGGRSWSEYEKVPRTAEGISHDVTSQDGDQKIVVGTGRTHGGDTLTHVSGGVGAVIDQSFPPGSPSEGNFAGTTSEGTTTDGTSIPPKEGEEVVNKQQ